MSREIFSLTADEAVYFNSKEDKIELVQCPNDKKECAAILPELNRHFQESHHYRLDKDYQKAIEALQHAFTITSDIQEGDCVKCAALLRSTIVSSMTLLHLELKDMTTGWFGNKRYLPALEMATKVLNEMNSTR